MYSCGILTVSDSCFYQNKEDLSGTVLYDEISSSKKFEPILRAIVPDNIEAISNCFKKWSDEDKVNLIITTGGTGMTARDVTPEATKSILDREALSISQALLIESLKITKFAILSRGISGIRKSTLIINFPGSPKAAKEYLSYVAPILGHAIDQICDRRNAVSVVHAEVQQRPITTVSTLSIDVMNRSRKSSFPLFTVAQALSIVLSKAERLPSKSVKFEDSLNMVTSEISYSVVNVPPFPASIKDGYAVCYADGAGAREIVSVSNAGDKIERPPTVYDEHSYCAALGTKCARISTGAKVPMEFDSVVQVEDTKLVQDINIDQERFVDIIIAPEKVGQDIRPIGNDLKIGEVVLDADVMVGACEIGLLAMGGVMSVSCVRRPVVGVLSTGNELSTSSDDKDDIRIIDCNRPLLVSLLRSYQICDVIDLGIVIDEPQLVLDSLVSALRCCDVIVTTGGVSMGEKDYLKSVLTHDLKAEIHFGRIFMKPGKPTTFSTICNNNTADSMKLVFSLPGNPVSAFVTSFLFVVPAVKKMAGIPTYEHTTIQAKLRHDVVLDIRPDYRRCKIWVIETTGGNYSYEVSSVEFGNQMSSRLSSCVSADGLVCLPGSSDFLTKLSKDSQVSVLKF